MEFSLRNMATNSSFKQSRFAAEITLAANETADSTVFPTAYSGLDDERAPGVFTVSLYFNMYCLVLNMTYLKY